MEAVRMCARCGGPMTAGGALYSAVRLSFRPQDARFMTLETGDVMTKAVMCQSCGVIENRRRREQAEAADFQPAARRRRRGLTTILAIYTGRDRPYPSSGPIVSRRSQ